MPGPDHTKEELVAHIASLNEELLSLRRQLDESDWVEGSLRRRTRQLNERMKELDCVYACLALVHRPGLSFEDRVQGVVDLLPPAFLHAKSACARAVLDGKAFASRGFEQSPSPLSASVSAGGRPAGMVEVHYRGEQQPDQGDGPFLKEERSLLRVVAECLGIIVETEKKSRP